MPRALYQKLGMKDDALWCILERPPHYFEILGDVGDVVFSETLLEQAHGVHFFAVRRQDLQERIEEMAQAIFPDGMLWLSWYKKSSKKWTDIDEDLIRSVIFPLGLVDVKVCAVDADWSGLKVVWRKERRNLNRS
ncbi:MAG: hypothetical protein KTR24_12725 [Saprospiraceae bacterium]|nr:hypothetical protein [Saprospiraceae bacterium]